MLRITAPRFCAGLVLNACDVVVRCAPIVRYMRGWTRENVRYYCRYKGWHCDWTPNGLFWRAQP